MDAEKIAWLGIADELFYALKEEFDVPKSWTFQVEASRVAPEELWSAQGAAAFMLRRIQAVRVLCELENSEARGHLLREHASALYPYLWETSQTGLVANPLHQGTVTQAAELTKNLLAASINYEYS